MMQEFEGRVCMMIYGLGSSDFERTRRRLYPGSSAPRGYVDGEQMQFDDLYEKSRMRGHVQRWLAKDSPLDIGISSTNSSCELVIKNESGSSVSGKLYVAIVENKVRFPNASWTNKVASGIIRKGLSDASGDQFSLGGGETFNEDYTFSLNSQWKEEDCVIIALVQKSDKEIVQVNFVKIGQTSIKNRVIETRNNPLATQRIGNTFRVSYALDKAQKVDLSLVSANGKVIISMLSGYCEKGTHIIDWNGSKNNVAQGIYFIHLQTEKISASTKIVY